ncbi:NAD(P)H-quinone oxidoreductase [Pseudomonas luteola]
MNALQGIEGQLEWQQLTSPALSAGEIRIQVAAAGLNRADLLQLAGNYPPPPGAPQTLGLECSGVVVEVGEGANWNVGDRVCALLAGGGMASEVVVNAQHAIPVPEGLSMAEAAALPEVWATAWCNLFELAALRPGEKVLLHAGASGVGSAAIQLCKAFDNPCWVSVGSAERLDYCISLGAEGGVDRHQGLEGLRDFGPFDVILDPVGASYAELNLDVLRCDGRWVLIGLMSGREAQFDLAKVLSKRISLIGSTLRNRDTAFKARLMAELAARVWPLFTEGKLKPNLERKFAAKDAEAAFAALSSNKVNGKVVMILDDSLI